MPSVILTATATIDRLPHSLEITFYPTDPRPFILSGGFQGNGRQVFPELPRSYRSARGARQAAALLTGEKLNWVAPEQADSHEIISGKGPQPIATSSCHPSSVPLMIDLADIAARLEEVEQARQRWKTLDAKALKATLQADEESERNRVAGICTVVGQQLLIELSRRVHLARELPQSNPSPQTAA